MLNLTNTLPDICDVNKAYRFYFKWLLGKLHELFKWENMPDTIDIDFLNNCLFLDGHVLFTDKLDKKLRCFYGEIGGEPNIYYMPTLYTVSNPVVGSANVNIDNDKEGVVMFNSREDKIYNFLPRGSGLFPLIHQTATLLADNIVSINTAQINSRVQACIIAGDEQLRNSAEVYVKDLYKGKPWTVVSQSMISSIKSNPISSAATPQAIQALVELHQYIIADFYNSIGIKTNPINKKERLITDEINSVDNYLAVTINQMLDSRKLGIEKVNKRFGTNIKVDVSDELKDVLENSKSNDMIALRKGVDDNDKISQS